MMKERTICFLMIIIVGVIMFFLGFMFAGSSLNEEYQPSDLELAQYLINHDQLVADQTASTIQQSLFIMGARCQEIPITINNQTIVLKEVGCD